ncbi:MAG: PEP-utilizing enzyme [Prochlorothrix sp.]
MRESPATLQSLLNASPEGAQLWQDLQDCIQGYGYLSDVGTDVAIPNWRDDPTPALALVEQFMQNPPPSPVVSATPQRQSWLQSRLALKGKVAQVYLQLLGEVRRSLLALADRGRAAGCLETLDDLFFLTWPELEGLVEALPAASAGNSGEGIRGAIADPAILTPIAQRRNQWYQATQQSAPFMVYGFTAALSADSPTPQRSPQSSTSQTFQGIGASRGQVEGVILVVQNLQTWPEIDRQTILVVPYTDAGWAPLLAQGAGVIAETGGRLSHGAIVAREYGIPAVMGLTHALTYFQTGQRVRLDGLHGTVTLLDP